MAFSLCLDYKNDKYYIHRAYSHNPDSPKTTNNQNFAMLFNTESAAIAFRTKNVIPEEYVAKFIVMRLPKESITKSSGEKRDSGYQKLNRGDISDSIPSFLDG